MAFLPWRTKRQLIYFGIFALIILALIAGLVWYFWPESSCSDGRENGGEEGVDCGGSCTPCIGEIKDISVLWARAFKSRGEIYDVAALMENPNIFSGLSSVKYQFKIYDSDKVLIAAREGKTFINPGERQVIFEGGISVGSRIPKYAYIEFDPVQNWKYIKKEKSFLSVLRKDFVNYPFPRLLAEIKNELFLDVKDVLVAAILYDASGNVKAVSFTKIDSIPPEASRPAFFTWPESFLEVPSAIEVIAITDLTK